MAVLDETNRWRTWAHLMREITEPIAGTKAQVRNLINAADDWAEANQASYNSAIPQPERGLFSTAVKALALCFVIMRRAGLLRVQED